MSRPIISGYFVGALMLVLPVFLSSPVSGQDRFAGNQTDPVRDALKQQLLPAGLIAASVFLGFGETRRHIQDFFPDTHTRVDDWLRYGPVVQLFAYDLFFKGNRNPVLLQAGNLLVSQFVTSSLVGVVKETTMVQRPSGGVHSYPSAHTALAFMGATLLYHEFRESRPLLAYSGYLFAVATGFLRITNDAHYLPDVLAGAGIGILVTNLVVQAGIGKKGLVVNGNRLEIKSCISEKKLIVSIGF
jgi:membrane-associated phospholipid phosphatase